MKVYKDVDVFVITVQKKDEPVYNVVHKICNGVPEVLRSVKESMLINGIKMTLADLNFLAIDCDRAKSDGYAQVDRYGDIFITTLYVNTITLEEESNETVGSPVSNYVFQATEKELLMKRGFTAKLLIYELRRFIRGCIYRGPMNQRHITQDNVAEIRKRIYFVASCFDTLDLDRTKYIERLYALAELYDGIEWISPETMAQANRSSDSPIKVIRHYISPINTIEHRYTEQYIM